MMFLQFCHESEKRLLILLSLKFGTFLDLKFVRARKDPHLTTVSMCLRACNVFATMLRGRAWSLWHLADSVFPISIWFIGCARVGEARHRGHGSRTVLKNFVSDSCGLEFPHDPSYPCRVDKAGHPGRKGANVNFGNMSTNMLHSHFVAFMHVFVACMWRDCAISPRWLRACPTCEVGLYLRRVKTKGCRLRRRCSHRLNLRICDNRLLAVRKACQKNLFMPVLFWQVPLSLLLVSKLCVRKTLKAIVFIAMTRWFLLGITHVGNVWPLQIAAQQCLRMKRRKG